jgi:peptide/nickel transport system permease protein
MRHIFAGKALQLIPILLLVTLGTTILLSLVPGDPAVSVLGPDATPAQYAQVRKQLNLDQPILTRYTDWVGNAVQGDLGTSLFPPNQPVTKMIGDALEVTVEIAFLSLVLSLALAIPLAMVSASRAGQRVDNVATGLSFAGISMPSFLVGLLLVYAGVFHRDLIKGLVAIVGALVAFVVGRWAFQQVREARVREPERVVVTALRDFGITLGVVLVTLFLVVWIPEFPRAGFVPLSQGLSDNLLHIALPVITLTVVETAVFTRVLRADLITTLGQDYVLSARAKGMPLTRIMISDALRPSLFSLVTLIGVEIGRLLGGTVIVETIFNLPGMGRLLVDAIVQKNYTVVQGTVLVIALIYIVALLVADLSYSYLDPRVRRAHV